MDKINVISANLKTESQYIREFTNQKSMMKLHLSIRLSLERREDKIYKVLQKSIIYVLSSKWSP